MAAELHWIEGHMVVIDPENTVTDMQKKAYFHRVEPSGELTTRAVHDNPNRSSRARRFALMDPLRFGSLA